MESGIDMRDEFEQNGFVILRDVFTESEIAKLSDRVDDIVHGRAAYLPSSEVIYEPDTEPPRIRNAFRMHLYNEDFLNAAKHAPLVAAVQDILGHRVRLYGSQVFAKPAEVGTEVPRHQDMPYWPFEPYEMLSAWIALDDSTVGNGCVRYVAGSHKLGILPHAPSGVPGNSLGLISDPRIAALPEHTAEVTRGSCILHHCLTVHRSEPNRSAVSRRGLIFVYMSDRVRLTDPSRLKGPADFPVVGE
jgi:ectoine hydroxylase-related dioxygenase (phytanoyl-CoA dioxygenase family)